MGRQPGQLSLKVAIRLVSMVIAYVTLVWASSLFGDGPNRVQISTAMGVLWAPQLLVMLIFIGIPKKPID